MTTLQTILYYLTNLRLKEVNLQNKEMELGDDTISKLKFLSRIQQGEKINVKNMFVQPEGLATRISRSFFHLDNRNNTLNFVKSTITQSFNILYSFLNTGTICQKNMCLNIIEDIIKSKDGISNLKITYSGDVMLCCQLDTIIQEIDAKIQELRDKFPDIIKANKSIT